MFNECFHPSNFHTTDTVELKSVFIHKHGCIEHFIILLCETNIQKQFLPIEIKSVIAFWQVVFKIFDFLKECMGPLLLMTFDYLQNLKNVWKFPENNAFILKLCKIQLNKVQWNYGFNFFSSHFVFIKHKLMSFSK